MTEIRWCAECNDERHFETPPCEDDHGPDCLDLSCVDCGAAIVLGVLVTEGTTYVLATAA